MLTDYLFAKNIRFSCAYLFRIKVGDKYLLVRDEQGREKFQPVGGVFKYYDNSLLDKFGAVQCMRLGYTEDLDSDLRIVVPRKKVAAFKRWYNKGVGRETPENLYREFEEEILDRIDSVNPLVFKELKYEFRGRHIEHSRYGKNNLQIRIADVFELILSNEQLKELSKLSKHNSNVYYFATAEEIYEEGRVNGNQKATISPHTRKILEDDERYLKPCRMRGKRFTCVDLNEHEELDFDSLVDIQKADMSAPFTFISYNSDDRTKVWNFCNNNLSGLKNIWIDKKQVGGNWREDVFTALDNKNCRKALIFINKEYLTRSTACFEEIKRILDNKIPHIVVLIDMSHEYITDTIKRWISSDEAAKDRLRGFKNIFGYDDDTGHIDNSVFILNTTKDGVILSALENINVKEEASV